ncbi:SLC13 family permease [Propionimicrobium sp. PCR01-08-3]|uniref:GntP family permease n=1 Tax=Propionimicrobium sp. PCR01-08-3 TaxID=3052086 RepID=UPI00255CAA23|nr:SLC13 family permease [Propionimicrobium sp. PCR01-08-3]WIY82159.1 SLC13 family permease [Propionimicrobium sp. PCR01-08-3]
MAALHTVIAIVAVVLLIIKFKFDPIVALVLGALYLGLASGIGMMATVEAITTGFGDIMADIGLLIGFGVLIGAMLNKIGAFQMMVEALVRAVPAKRLPYALAAVLATIAPSIYVDVQVVLAAPVARSSAKYIGAIGRPWMAGALGIGIFAGYVFVVPGLAAISIVGLLDLTMGTYLLFGIVIGPLTAMITIWIYRRMLTHGWWKEEKDEEDRDDNLTDVETSETMAAEKRPRLLAAMSPILVPLLMIAFGAFAGLAGLDVPIVNFIGDATVALFVGLLIAYAMTRHYVKAEETQDAFTSGLRTSGEILLVTGVGGSLGDVIKATGLADILGGLFTAEHGMPVVLIILMAWFVAALMHMAIGSVSVAAITAAGILAPVVSGLPIAPIIIGLAIASGSLFALQVNSNFFWMYKALLGLSTQGTLKTMTTVTAMGSLISLPIVMAASLLPIG